MEFQLSYFKSWKMMLWKCCTPYAGKFGKLSSGHRTEKGQIFTPIPKKGNAKECSDYHTVAFMSHASKVVLKILQARLQQYMNRELPDVQAGFRKGKGTREWKSSLKTRHSKNEDREIRFHPFMANRWGNNGNWEILYFPGLLNHCRWWLQPWNKRCLLLGRKAMTNLDSILKSRDITLLTKVCLVKAMVFPVVFYGCENWTVKKAEC